MVANGNFRKWSSSDVGGARKARTNLQKQHVEGAGNVAGGRDRGSAELNKKSQRNLLDFSFSAWELGVFCFWKKTQATRFKKKREEKSKKRSQGGKMLLKLPVTRRESEFREPSCVRRADSRSGGDKEGLMDKEICPEGFAVFFRQKGKIIPATM